MSDKYISRDYLLDRVDEIVQTNHLRPDYVWFTPNGVKTLAKEAPAADVVERPRWIPVTERLPDKSGNYLTAFEDGTAMAVNEFMHPRDWLTEEGRKAHPYGKWYWGDVTHWMPLPEPPICGAKMDLPEPPKDEAPTGPYDLLYEEGGANTT